MNNWEQNAQSWYAPLERPAEPAKETKKKRRLSTRWKAGLAVLLVLALIAGSSLLFSSGEEEKLPGPDVTFPESEEDLPDDIEEFFETFYSREEKKEEIRVPAAEEVPEFTLEFSEPGEELTLQELYRQCADSIVSITGYTDGTEGYYWGSGIVLSKEGLILTNTHLIEDCDSATVTLTDNRSFDAFLVGADAMSDIAVLKIEADGLKPARFGDSAKLQVGDRVAAIGNPIGEEFHLTLTEGIVSGIDRGVGQYGRNITAIQNTAAINEGSSGGALFNMYGQVVGVTNMKMSAPIGEVTIEGMSLAVPTSLARTVIDDLIRDGEVRGRTALGITVGPIPQMAVSRYEIPDGLYVTAVSAHSDAEAKGIRKGDILTALNGEALLSTDQIYEAKSDLHVGDTLHFTVWRDGETFDLDIALVDYNDVY
ncbi:MAG: trypsin-like peptidase domain-containing protein [Eubacteriales bacterium]|nr:trypsin-like peptidase domain-containing protein [Eubacteriales bacterium]